MRPNTAICSYIQSFIDFHPSRLDHPSQGGNIYTLLCRLGKTHHWAVEMTFLTPPLNFDQSDHTQPSPRHHGSIHLDRFGYDANSGEISHRRRRHGKTFHHWEVEMTFLTPPLDFDQSGQTQPSPRHHGSIYVDWFGYDAASSGEMNHRRLRSSLVDIVFYSLAMYWRRLLFIGD
jgi:hypothetical protein